MTGGTYGATNIELIMKDTEARMEDFEVDADEIVEELEEQEESMAEDPRYAQRGNPDNGWPRVRRPGIFFGEHRSENEKISVYLAGPIENGDNNGVGWRETVKTRHADKPFEFVSPLDKYDRPEDLKVISNDDPMTETYHNGGDRIRRKSVVLDDLELISRCDAVLAHWPGEPSHGTASELIHATYHMAKPVAGFGPGDREGLPIWVDAFIGPYYNDHGRALSYLRGRLHP